MKRRILTITVTVLAVCVIVGTIIAAICIPQTSAENDTSAVDYYYSDRSDKLVIIAPKDMVCDAAMFESFNSSNPYSSYPDDQVEEVIERECRRFAVADKIFSTIHEFLINKYDDYETYPSYYAGDYYMTQREEGLDIPYELDGTDRPFKFCVRLVSGMEAEAKELTDLLTGYEDYIVYKYTEHSYVELSNFVHNIAVPKMKELGISPNSYGADTGSDRVVIAVPDTDYEKAFSVVESLVAEYGIAVELSISECAEHDIIIEYK